MSEERLELVTDFAALRAGMIVVNKSCGWCQRAHRGILTMPFEGMATYPDGRRFYVHGWHAEPTRGCGKPTARKLHCDDRAVSRGTVFRVVDGLDPEADKRAEVIFSTAAQLRKEKVRP